MTAIFHSTLGATMHDTVYQFKTIVQVFSGFTLVLGSFK